MSPITPTLTQTRFSPKKLGHREPQKIAHTVIADKPFFPKNVRPGTLIVVE
jgi:hypothetical protein